jgi:putative FmdB family regulatory protein
MALYEYMCDHCNKITTRSFDINSDIDEIKCDYCGKKAKKIISHSTFILKGGGWYAEGYSKSNK